MRSKLLLPIGAGLLGLVAGWLLGLRPAKQFGEAPLETPAAQPAVRRMPPPRKPDLPTAPAAGGEIPLSSNYTTVWRENGLRVPRREGDEEFTVLWQRLRTP